MTTQTLTPAEAAEATGLSLDTLRYYEREGLIGPIDRTMSGRRTYSDGDVAWIETVTCMRAAGLGIDHLREFTSLLREEATVEERVRFLHERRVELLAQIEAIRNAVVILDDKIAHFSEPG